MVQVDRIGSALSGQARRLERRLPAPVRRFERWLRGPELVITSSSLAFYGLISIPPMVLIAFWLAGVVLPEAQLDTLVDEVARRSPDEVPAGDVVRGLFELAARAGPFAILAAAWPATAYGAALGRAFSEVATGEEQRIRGWKGRLFALVVIAMLPLIIISAVAALYLGPRVLGTGTAFTLALVAAALTAVWLLVAVIFALYRLRDASPTDVALAAAATTGLELMISGGYLLYLRLGADFTGRYGTASLATLVLFALWLLLGHAVLLVGYRLLLRLARRRREIG